jgi:hypothetical protein
MAIATRAIISTLLILGLNIGIASTKEQDDKSEDYFQKYHGEFLNKAIKSNTGHVTVTDHTVDADHARFVSKYQKPKFATLDNDDNGNHNGQMGREYARKLIKAARDIETVKALYTVPIFDPAHPNDNCELYAYGAAIPSSIMRPNVFIRIHPVGSFNTSDSAAEYFLLACPLLDRPLPPQVRVSRVTFPRMTAWDNTVWFQAKLELSIPSVNFLFNHTHMGYTEMDNNSVICGGEFNFRRLELRDPAPETQTDAVLNARISSFCNSVVTACANSSASDADKYQANSTHSAVEVCITFNSIPARKQRFGYQWVDQDSLKCREFHLGLIVQSIARGLPDHQAAHCTHSGPLGGGKCVTHAFESFQFDVTSCPA